MSNSNNKQQHQHLLKLKGFVNNTTQWKAFNELLDFLTEMEHKTMEQAVDTIDIYKAQGSVKTIRYLKHLRDYVNAEQENKNG